MLTLDQINTYYGASHILHDLSLYVPKGKVTVLLGRNGMGKTTTIHSIMGLAPPNNGKIIFDQKEIQQWPSYKIAKSGIALVPQGRRIFSNLTVKENLTTTARPTKDGWTLEKIYDMFPRLKERRNIDGRKFKRRGTTDVVDRESFANESSVITFRRAIGRIITIDGEGSDKND